MSSDELKEMQTQGAIIYLKAYIHGMGRGLNIESLPENEIRQMIIEMVEPINLATETIWRGMMNDHNGMQETLKRFEKSVVDL